MVWTSECGEHPQILKCPLSCRMSQMLFGLQPCCLELYSTHCDAAAGMRYALHRGHTHENVLSRNKFRECVHDRVTYQCGALDWRYNACDGRGSPQHRPPQRVGGDGVNDQPVAWQPQERRSNSVHNSAPDKVPKRSLQAQTAHEHTHCHAA